MLSEIANKHAEGILSSQINGIANHEKTHQSIATKLSLVKAYETPDGAIRRSNDTKEFHQIWDDCVMPVRDDAGTMMKWLQDDSDFFFAPASVRNHGNYPGGLVHHSLNVYACLKDILRDGSIYARLGVRPSEDTIAIVALLHDICKANFYSVYQRNVKNEYGRWVQTLGWTYDDEFPYGHGEKSEYIASKHMRLTDEEAVAIRHHMGFSMANDAVQKNWFSQSAAMTPLALALSEADGRASILLE